MQRLMTSQEVAEILGTDVQRIWDLARKKMLPYVRLGERQLRFSPQAIERFIADGGNQSSEVSDDEK